MKLLRLLHLPIITIMSFTLGFLVGGETGKERVFKNMVRYNIRFENPFPNLKGGFPDVSNEYENHWYREYAIYGRTIFKKERGFLGLVREIIRGQ